MVRLFLFLLFLWPIPAWAADGAAGDMVSSILKVLAALGVVLGLVLLLYAFSRKGRGWLPSAKGGALRVVETRHLAPKKFLCLVEVRGEELLLGVGQERVELLARLGQPGEKQTEGFADALESALGSGR